MRAWLNRVLRHEEINGAERCPTYLHRWTLLQVKNRFSVYLHKFVGDDWSRDLHDHPKRFISIGLSGGYIEETFIGAARECPCDLHHEHVKQRVYLAPWIRTFPATHVHRLRLLPDRRPCWTLVIVLRPVRAWGFWHGGQWIPWRRYVDSDIATEQKSC